MTGKKDPQTITDDFGTKAQKYAALLLSAFFLAAIFFFALPTGKNVFLAAREAGRKSLSAQFLEDAYIDNVYLRESLVSLNGGFRRLIGQDVIRDADPNNLIVHVGGGYLTAVTWIYDMIPKARNIAGFAAALGDIPLLYVQTPYKVIDGVTELPVGIDDFSNQNADQLLSELKAEGVSVLDLRENIKREFADPMSLFYRTDHHWKTGTALWAAETVNARLSEDYALPSDPAYTGEDKYKAEFFPGIFLGSQGKRVGYRYAGADDFELITPSGRTDFTLSILRGANPEVREGDFTESLLYQPLLDMTQKMGTSYYGVYFGGDYAEVIVRNHLARGSRILLIKDSFSLPFAAFLSVAHSELRMLDLRYFTRQSALDYALEYRPDIVLVMYSPSSFASANMFSFMPKSD